MRLTEEFFARPSVDVAKELIGRRIIRQIGDRQYAALIAETGAYRGGSREGLRYGPGKIYVAMFRGGNSTLCIGTEAAEVSSVVTIRRAYPMEGLQADLGGASRLTKSLNIDKQLNGMPISGDELFIEGQPVDPSAVRYVSPQMEKMAENCLGYFRF